MNTVTLPIPPSTNRIWRLVPGKPPMKSREYRLWQEEAGWSLAHQRPEKLIGPVSVSIRVPRTNSRRDLDNTIKPLLDAIVTAGCITDDSAVMELYAAWNTEAGAGAVEISYWPFKQRVPEAANGKVTLGLILSEVCAHFGLDREQILGPRRARSIAWPRQLAFLLACEMTARSLPEIGQFFDRDHTSIMYGRDRARDRVDHEEEWEKAYTIIKGRIGGQL